MSAHGHDKIKIATFSHFAQSLVSRIACVMTMYRVLSELHGIPETMRLLTINEAYIITSDEEKTITVEGLTIKIVTAWKWLVE